MTGKKSSPYERACSRICFLAARSSAGNGARVCEAIARSLRCEQICGQAVDARLVLLRPVFADAVLALLRAPLGEHHSLFDELVARHAEAAGRLQRLDAQDDDLPLAGELIKLADQVAPRRVARADDFAAAVHTEDHRLLVERAEHDRQPPSVEHMRCGLTATAGEIEIGD